MVGPPAYCIYLLLRILVPPNLMLDLMAGKRQVTCASRLLMAFTFPVTNGLSHKKASCHFQTILNPRFFAISLFPKDKFVAQFGVLKPVTKTSACLFFDMAL